MVTYFEKQQENEVGAGAGREYIVQRAGLTGTENSDALLHGGLTELDMEE